MSYDISIRADRSNARTKREDLSRYLVDELGLVADSMDHFRIIDQDGGTYSDLDLLAAGLDGRLEYAGDEVHCIQVHIPAGFLAMRRDAVFDLCRAIAHHIGWRPYDEQAGQYLDV